MSGAIGGLILIVAGCNGGGGTETVTLKGAAIEVEWIRTDNPERRYAAVNRERCEEGRGFLVGYSHDRIQHFFSSGSRGAFDVAFLDGAGAIVDKQALGADSEEGITSAEPARYALFLREGWLARHNSDKGDRVELSSGVRERAPEPMPEVKIGGVPLRVEISRTQAARQRGLMHRRTMSSDDGMIFLFPREKTHDFWMRNCRYGLDIAYFKKDGAFVNLVPMNPYPNPKEDGFPKAASAGSAQFVIETRKGWFRSKGLVDAEGKPAREIRLELPASVREFIGKAEDSP